MNTSSCPFNDSVIQATRSGSWSESLKSHIADCALCRESRDAVRWMIELANSAALVQEPLPDTRLIWLKARISRRSRIPERALLPLRIGSLSCAAGLTALFAGMPRDNWSWVQQWQERGSTLASKMADPFILASPALWWIPVGVLLLFLLIFTTSEA